MKKAPGVLVYYMRGGHCFVLGVHSNGRIELEPWSVPKGEFDLAKETPAQAAVREVEEEVGLRIPEAELVPLGESRYSNRSKRVYCFAWRIDSPPLLRPDPREVAMAGFCDLDEARAKLHRDQVVFLDRLAALVQS